MKRKIKYLSAILVVVVVIASAYGYGYYRGVNDASVKAASFNLAMNEAIFDALKRNSLDQANGYLKVIISGESNSLRALTQNPVGYFRYEVTTAHAGDIPKQLEKADEITKGMHDENHPAKSE